MTPASPRAPLAQARRIVVKIGSALLADALPAESGPVDPFERFAAQVHALRASGHAVAIVSSGAIALGLSALRLKERPRDLASLQAAAAAGQSKLMQRWGVAFAQHGIEVAQILLTHADLKDRRRYVNARGAFLRLLEAGVVPIVNENDTVATEEIKLGDNDTLAAQVCGLCDADAVVLLTGAAGLYTADPKVDPAAVRVPVVDVVTDAVRALAGPPDRLGTGGMKTKLDAAVAAQTHGASTLIAPGREADVLQRLFAGEDIGTWVRAPAGAQQQARKRWISTALRPKARVVIDAGAVAALKRNASLLYAGVTAVEGDFDAGDAVDVVSPSGVAVARGLVRTDSALARRAQGLRTADVEAAAGEPIPDELIHRDDLVLLTADSAPRAE